MQKLALLLTIFLFSCSLAQKNGKPDTQRLAAKKSRITSPTFAEVIGINGGLFLGANDTVLENAGVFKNNRIYYLMGHDMKGRLPKDFIPKPCMAQCPNINCDWKNTNAAWKFRLCDWSRRFAFNTISLEVFEGTGRNYPNRFYRPEELGDAYRAGLAYGTTLAKSLEGLVQAVEVGNEPHGTPGIKVFNEWSRGIAEGVRKNSKTIKICSADIQNSGPDYFGNTLLNNQVKDIDTSIFDILQVHAYGFDKNFKVTRPPESFRNELSDMKPYLDKELWLGEVGWDSELLGEETQAAYLLRAIVLAMRHGFDKVFVYNAVDDGPWATPFDHCGLMYRNGKPKQSYDLLKKMVTEYGNFRLSKIIHDGKGGSFEYQLTDGRRHLRISWDIGDVTLPKIRWE